MRRLPVAVLFVALLPLAAACGGGSSGATSQPSTAAATDQVTRPTAAPDTGAALRRFVEAAGAGDAATVWSLLSTVSQERLGPTQEDFARRYTESFRTGVGTFAGTAYETVLAVEMPSGWGVAAIAGDRVRQGQDEYGTYAAALRFEDGAWKLELGDEVVLRSVSPAEDPTADRRPPIGVRIQAPAQVEEVGIWLDGQPLRGKASGTSPHDVTITGLPPGDLAPGQHVIVVFGRAGELAAAGSTPFRVSLPTT